VINAAELSTVTRNVVLDLVKIVTDPATGRAALSTIESPRPVVMDSVSTTAAELASSQVTAPSAGVSDPGAGSVGVGGGAGALLCIAHGAARAGP
jgi:hypothetical protein